MATPKQLGRLDLETVPGARRAPFPTTVEPQLATLVREPPLGDMWLHEPKLDGYRIIGRSKGGKCSMRSRNDNDWTGRMPSLAAELEAMPFESLIFDGEVAALGPDGLTDFQLLQNSMSNGGETKLVYFVFDLLYLDGYDLRGASLESRKAILGPVLRARRSPRLRTTEQNLGRGPEFFRRACSAGLEGIISKRTDQPYRSGRSGDWLKIKCLARQEFVIGGYTAPNGSRTHLGALLLGVVEGDEVRYVGKVGTGFTQKSLADLHARLAPLIRQTPAFRDPPRGGDAKDVQWVEPKLVAEVEFTAFTRDGLLRHPTFRGLREDKPARDVTVENPVPAPQPRARARRA